MSRALFKRVEEKELRPKMLKKLVSSLNISFDFIARMKNLSSEVQIFTDVEVTTLETLVNEIQVCLLGTCTYVCAMLALLCLNGWASLHLN